MPTLLLPMRFELAQRAVSAAEQRPLDADLEAHGLGRNYWDAMNGLLTTGSRSDTPLVLRAMRGEQLVGATYLMECRRISRCLFPGALGRALDTVPMPSYCWTRGDAAVDLLSSSGFVAAGEDRDTFYREAVAFLNTRYMSGTVMEERGTRAAADCYETVTMEWGRYPVECGGTDALLDHRRNLRRKVAKYRNKGGRDRGGRRRAAAARSPGSTAVRRAIGGCRVGARAIPGELHQHGPLGLDERRARHRPFSRPDRGRNGRLSLLLEIRDAAAVSVRRLRPHEAQQLPRLREHHPEDDAVCGEERSAPRGVRTGHESFQGGSDAAIGAVRTQVLLTTSYGAAGGEPHRAPVRAQTRDVCHPRQCR